ncbi:MAG: TolC family protein [Pirellulaceae bacterium]|nr:TolC family protein [Pirellulaceae bacterium]
MPALMLWGLASLPSSWAFAVLSSQEPLQENSLPIENHDRALPYSPTVEGLLEIAYSQHPEIMRSSAGIEQAEGNRFQATRRPNPEFGYSGSEIGNEGRAGQQGIYLSQEWVTAGKLEIAGAAGQHRIIAAGERLEWARLSLNRRVQNQYWSLVAARKRVELLRQIESLLSEAVQNNEALFNAGERGKGDLLQARLELNQLSVRQRQAAVDQRVKTEALAATLGVSTDWIDQLPSDSWPTSTLSKTWITQANSAETWLASPEIAEAAALIEAARCDLRLAQSQITSNVNSFASVQHDAATNDVIVGIQVGAAIPIRDRKTGLIKAARAELAEREALLSSRCRDLHARWIQAQGDFEAAQEMIRSINDELLKLAEERLELARQAHHQGEIDYLELLTAQRSYLTVLQSAIDAHEQATLAFVRLETLAVDESADFSTTTR